MKAGHKIAIAAGGLILVSGVAYALSPKVRRIVSGTPEPLTPHQKLQREINRIISTRSFVNGDFISRTYNEYLPDANADAQEFIFEMANKEMKVPGETWDNFSYSGLAILNLNYVYHISMQRQINRIMQSSDYAEYRAQLKRHYRNNITPYDEVARGIYYNASDDTQVPGQFKGAWNEYHYYPMGNVDEQLSATGYAGMKSEILWYLNFFNGGTGSAGYQGGGPGDVGNTSGGGSGSGSGGGGGTGAGIDLNGNQILNWIEQGWCAVFPESCESDPNFEQCGLGSIYDEATNSCIPDPNYSECGPGSHLNENGQCVPDDVNVECGEGSIYDAATDSCIPDPNYNPCGPGSHLNENGQCVPDIDPFQCEEGYVDLGDGNGCQPI